ncbi:VWA domain-containing protein [Faunimonas sp. B44]|uniref:VWA domain-containing protein n=1 Tax=Faunimonas sp. B44 TaxID=3461493 RepID=UPI0040444F6A
MSSKNARPPAPTGSGVPEHAAADSEVDAFLKRAAALAPVSGAARGRLIFALDATMSRQPTWDLACELQAGMFDAAGSVGGLAVQLVYFRGFGECQASRWVADTRALRDLMVRIDCRGGHTQIRKVLAHVRREAEKRPVAALAYVGDAMEENPDDLAALAGELGLLGVRAFMFQEGRDPAAERTFREIARLTNGAHLRFDAASAGKLSSLLAAVATYAAGGLKALRSSRVEGAQQLLAHLK